MAVPALDPDTIVALTCAGGVALAFLCGVAAFSGTSGSSRRYQRRLGAVKDRTAKRPVAAAAVSRSLERAQSATPGIDRIAGRWLPNRDALRIRLMRTGREWSIGHYAMATVALGAFMTIVTSFIFRLGIVPAAMIGLAVGVIIPHMMVGRMGKKRTSAFLNLFPEAIDLMVRALRSGLPIGEAIITAGQEIGDPVGIEFRQVESGMRLGRDLEQMLWEIAKRIDLPEFRFFIIALSVQRETGGNLAETLANLADVLRRRRQMRTKARAMSSEARASTMILGSLPILMVLILSVTSPDYISKLYTDVRGLVLCGIALTMLGGGCLIMSKMAKFEI